jgi:cytochrome P450
MTSTDLNPHRLGPDFGRNPFPFLETLSQEGPVARVTLPDGTDAWFVTRYDEVIACLSDHERFSSEVTRAVRDSQTGNSQALIRKDETLRYTMINRDPPDHTRMRKLVVRAFGASRVDGLRPTIQGIADDLLDQLAGQDQVDLVSQYAFPLPVRVICGLLGVPQEDSAFFGKSITRLLAARGPEDALQGISELKSYIGEKLQEKRAKPADDVLTGMVQAADESGLLNEAELPAMALQLLTAGHETTIYMISAGTLRLLQHPDQLAMLRNDPSLMPAAVDELLRYDGPAMPGVFRYAKQDVQIGAATIPAGALVIASLPTANRDPRQYSTPSELDLSRQEAEHLAFGHGIHYCLGARLARLEVGIAIGSLIRRFPELSLAISPDEVRWKPLNFLRSLVELPVRPGPSA